MFNASFQIGAVLPEGMWCAVQHILQERSVLYETAHTRKMQKREKSYSLSIISDSKEGKNWCNSISMPEGLEKVHGKRVGPRVCQLLPSGIEMSQQKRKIILFVTEITVVSS